MIFVDLLRTGDGLKLVISEIREPIAPGDGHRVLGADGRWGEMQPEGSYFSDYTLTIPGRSIRQVLAKLREEIDRYEGKPPAATEAVVLREALEVERRRVDMILDRSTQR